MSNKMNRLADDGNYARQVFNLSSLSAWIRLLPLIGIMALYLSLLLPTVARQGISWDEQTDLSITRAYLKPGGWLIGSDLDPSQTRLPMALVALVYALLNTSDLITGRLVSVGVGLLTLAGLYIYCLRPLSRGAGLLACSLLATSPFFLSFARVAFTESDIYLACVFAWLLVCMDRLREQAVLGWAVLVGIILGIALSAKATALAVIPVIWLAVFQVRAAPTQRVPFQEKAKDVLAVVVLTLLLAVSSVILAASGLYQTHSRLRLLLFLVVLAGWLLVLAWAVWNRHRAITPLALCALLTSLALLTFLVLPPEHLTNPAILRALLNRFGNEVRYNPGFMLEAGALHILSIIFKSGPVIGVGMLVGWAYAISRWRRQETCFPALLSLCYFAGLVLLPLAQTFYTVPLLPILATLMADLYLRIFARWRAAAIGLAVLVVVLLGVDLNLCYPDYNLNGYQWLGLHQLAGRSSVGYRSVVQTPSDGVEQAITWLNANARPGDRVSAYVLEWHIVQAIAPNPVYQIENSLIRRSFLKPDFVVVHINYEIPQSWWGANLSGDVFRPPYDPAWLNTNYEKVFSVSRAFSIEMASVWRKKMKDTFTPIEIMPHDYLAKNGAAHVHSLLPTN